MPVPMPTPMSRGSSRTMLAKSVLPGSPACPEGTVSAQKAGRELSAPLIFLVRGAQRPCCAQPHFTPQLTRDFCSSPCSLPQPSSGSARTKAEGPGGAVPKQQQERAVLETPRQTPPGCPKAWAGPGSPLSGQRGPAAAAPGCRLLAAGTARPGDMKRERIAPRRCRGEKQAAKAGWHGAPAAVGRGGCG